MEKNTTKSKVASGLFWAFGERIIAQGVSFVLSIILARILLPNEYGIIAIVLVFINIANVFTNSGFGEALIQKKDANEVDFSTMFYCALIVSCTIYIGLFFLAPYIATFYNNRLICSTLRVLSLKLIISSLSTIQHAYVQKKMIFKKFFFSTLGGTLISGIVGIVMAKNGFGVWALVFQYLSNTIIDSIVLLFTVSWRPKLMFSKDSAAELMSFAWKMVLANLVNVSYNELRSLVIGKKFTSAELAYYNKGNHFPQLAIVNIDTSISNVMFPAMASAASAENLKDIGRKSMKMTSYIIFPVMVGLLVIARPLLLALLTEKWESSIFYMQILCIYWMTQPIQTMNWQIIKAAGRSEICLKLEVLKKTIGILILIIAIPFGAHAIAISAAFVSLISMIINMVPNKKLINYSIVEQLKDLLPAFLGSIVMGIIVYPISLIFTNPIFALLIQVFLGIAFYLLISTLFKIDSFIAVLDIIKNKKDRWKSYGNNKNI